MVVTGVLKNRVAAFRAVYGMTVGGEHGHKVVVKEKLREQVSHSVSKRMEH